jgi:Dictyostelium (slime mold) repeat
MRASSRLLAVTASVAVALGGCDGCGRRESRAGAERVEAASAPAEVAPGRACSSATDCSDRDPCTNHECIDERCVASLAPSGTSCDNDTVCDGVATCDANGRCVAGSPPLMDDGNACTVDACDPKRGVVHEPMPIDDFDACTSDACDPATGSIAHDSLVIDDQNDCTLDSCDPRAGVKHEVRSGKYTCQASCEPGLHVASRSRAVECGSAEALRSYCAPNCGPSFHTCDATCPSGYEKRSATPGGTCGTSPSVMTFCMKEG